MTDDRVREVLDSAQRTGEAADALLRERIGPRTPTDEERSQAWESVMGADASLYAQMMARHGVYAASSGIGDGWVPLVDRLLTDLKALGWNGTVKQVKEKLGGLRFYYDHDRYEWRADPTAPNGGEVVKVVGTPDDADVAAMHRLVDAAEAASFSICEQCGAPAELRVRGNWYLTACADHAGGAEPVKRGNTA
jgi:hypothetical protein